MLARFLRLLLAMIICQVLILGMGLFLLGAAVMSREGGVPAVHAHSTLALRISGDLVEYETLPDIPFLNESPPSLTAIVDAVDQAAGDDRIESVFVELDFPALGWAGAEELRGAIARFRAAGKPVFAFGAVLGEVAYYVAAACDSVYLPPQGKLALNGMAMESMYYKGLMDKAGVRANLHRIGAYKGAAEPYLRDKMSDPARRNAEWLLDDLWMEFRDAVARDRKLGPGSMDEVIELGTLQPEEALDAKLIDDIRYRQDLEDSFRDDNGDSRLVDVATYGKAGHAKHDGPLIAVVHTAGFIRSGKNGFNPMVGTTMGDESVLEDLQAAVDNDDVKAIVLRIDSPGGEVLASDVIGNAVERAKEEKPVVVSMADVAASGGYMMAYRASRIVALPNTLTGSIGSFTGKFNLHGLYGKAGLTKDYVTRGAYPLLDSDYHDWSAREETLVVRQHWEDYDRWISDIAANRGLEPAEVDSVARGRVWSGRQALDRKLVDELGDLHRAVRVAAGLASFPADAKVHTTHYPRPVTLLDVFQERGDLFSSAVARWARGVTMPRAGAYAVLDWRVSR